jgi:hypothetical protein
LLKARGTLSGRSVKAIAEANDYGMYRLSREENGQSGFARSLVEQLCIVVGSRLCGLIWREGPGVVGASASQGHWLAASYITGKGNWRNHRWVFKDSVGSAVRDMTSENLLALLDEKEKRRLEFGLVVDLR